MDNLTPWKEALKERTLYGCFVTYGLPDIAEVTALMGFDFLLLDNEHGVIEQSTLADMVRASQLRGVPAVVRCTMKEYDHIQKALDFGANGVQLPLVNTAEDARLPRPQGHTVFDTEGALVAAHNVGYPTMVRPSYVLGGRAMEIVYNDDELRNYMTYAVKASHEHPVLVDHYLQGTEVEVDAICDGKEVLIPGIMEHVERAGVHSGDSIAVYPPRSLSESVIRTIIEYTNKMALGLEVKGMINIQYIVRDEHVYVIEVNPRSSRTVPFLSKITGISMVDVATRCAMGMSLKEQGLQAGLRFFPDYYAVKAPVFSFNKMSNVDITLGPEMKSTGEVMACDYQYSRALYKACIASGINVPHEGAILITVADMDKPEAVAIARGFEELGYTVIATGGTAEYLQQYGVTVEVATKVSEGHPNLIDDIKSGRIGMVINTTNHGRDAERDGFKIRRSTVEHAIACLTSMDTARELLNVMSAMRRRSVVRVTALQDLTWED